MQRRTFLFQAAAWSATAARGAVPAEAASAAVRHTNYGAVVGETQDGILHFLGIPYGADTRLARFQPPVPPQPWAEPLLCRAFADRAPQLGGSGLTTRSQRVQPADTYHLPPDQGGISENCLHLNLWTPALERDDRRRRPVLVYIHGGAYNSGSVNNVLYDGTRLCQRGDVVVVTVNHRLNAFGFLSLAHICDDPRLADSGNAGMLDLVLALRWVRENIAHFGGDPKRVTIFGQSGGGAKCATLMAMPPAHGLFHRVMTMSGQQVTAAPAEIATARTQDFLRKANLDNVPPRELLRALQAAPLPLLEDAARVSSAWLPVVDGRSLPRDPFSPDAPPLSAGIPMILGNTHDETRGLIGGAHPEFFSLTWEQEPSAVQQQVGSFLGALRPEAIVADYRAWYPEASPADVFFRIATAFRSWPGQVIEAERRAQSPAGRRTWVYQMDWPSPVGDGRFGAPHTVDIPFFFDNLQAAPGMVGASPGLVAAAQPLADRMSDALIAFARTGDPNGGSLPHWPAYDLQRRGTMVWNTPPRVVDDPRGRERVLAATAHYRQPGT